MPPSGSVSAGSPIWSSPDWARRSEWPLCGLACSTAGPAGVRPGGCSSAYEDCSVMPYPSPAGVPPSDVGKPPIAANQRVGLEAAAKDRFLATVSHELRTPLTAVRGFADILDTSREAMATIEQAEMVMVIAEQARDMSDLIDDLLVGAST